MSIIPSGIRDLRERYEDRLWRWLCARRVINSLPAPRLRPDDVILASYPRSGNTWVRAILAYMLYPEDRITCLADLNHLVPDIHMGIPEHNEYSIPRVVKTHQPYGMRHEPRSGYYRRVIYVVRHPYDVFRSYYKFHVSFTQPPHLSFEDFLARILSGNFGRYGSWQEHVLSWITLPEQACSVLVLRYEDMLESPGKGIQDLAGFLDVSLNESALARVVENTTLDHMHELERRGPVMGKDNDFLRKPSTQRRKLTRDLDEDLKRRIYEHCRLAMERLGYRQEHP